MTDPHLAKFDAVKAAIAAAKCVHLGEPLSPEQAGLLGLGTVRTWRPCAKGHGEPGKSAGFVACCRTDSVCSPKCRDYSARSMEAGC